MAIASGTYYSSSSLPCSSAYYLYVHYEVTSQSIVNNTSTVYVSAGIRKSYSNSGYYDSGAIIWCNAGSGRWVTSSSGDYCRSWVDGGWNMTSSSVGTEKRYAWKTFTVSHNADGTCSIPLYAAFQTPNISGATSVREVSRSSVALPTIARATTPTLSKTSADMGSAVTIDLTGAAVSTFTHDLTYKLPDGTAGTIATGLGAVTRSWTVPDCASLIPNTTSCPIEITCTTYNAGGTSIGSKTVSLTATVPASVVPTISAVSVTEAVSGLASTYKAFIQTKSRLAVSITAAGAKGSTISGVSSSLEGGVYTGTSWTSGYIAGSGTVNIVTTVTDSRGRTAQKTTAVSVLAYSRPAITAFSASRVNSSGTSDTDGTYALIKYAYSVPTLNGGNTASMTIRCKQASAASYSTTMTTGTALTANTSVRPTTTLSNSYRWDIQITVTDRFGAATTATVQLPSGQVILDFKADGTGMGIGKTSEQTGLDVNWPITARQGVIGNVTGNASTATKLGTATVGGAGTPIYLNAGAPAACTPATVRSTIGAAAAWKLLWTNASPTSSFAAQTITISGLSAYNLFIVSFRRSTSVDRRSTSLAYTPDMSDIQTHCSDVTSPDSGSTAIVRQRTITITRQDNTMAFSYGYQSSSGSSGSDNSVMIPLYILGTTI